MKTNRSCQPFCDEQLLLLPLLAQTLLTWKSGNCWP
jgi:hypothetical protein